MKAVQAKSNQHTVDKISDAHGFIQVSKYPLKLRFALNEKSPLLKLKIFLAALEYISLLKSTSKVDLIPLKYSVKIFRNLFKSISSPWLKKILNIHVLKCSRLTIFFLLWHDPITFDSDDFSPPFDRELENNYTP